MRHRGAGLLDERSPGPSRSLARFDVFPKVSSEVRLQTQSGGLVTVVSLALVLVLMWSEAAVFLRRDFSDRIAVDLTLREQLQININITFHALGCQQIEIITMDVTGEHQTDVAATVTKVPVALEGGHDEVECQDCFGAGDPGRCCNSCPELVEAYAEMGWDPRKILGTAPQCESFRDVDLEDILKSAETLDIKHACNLFGSLKVNKVAGNFHVALGHGQSVNGRLVHQFSATQLPFFNTSHTIHSLWFGDSKLRDTISPLEGQVRIVDPHQGQTEAFQYFLEVVPTEYRGRRFYQYTKTEQGNVIGPTVEERAKEKEQTTHSDRRAPSSVLAQLPGVFFVYDLSPFVVMRTDLVAGWSRFLTNLLAIVGGTFALSRFIDNFSLQLICALHPSK